jgi:hypothetical protein
MAICVHSSFSILVKEGDWETVSQSYGPSRKTILTFSLLKRVMSIRVLPDPPIRATQMRHSSDRSPVLQKPSLVRGRQVTRNWNRTDMN